MEGNLTQPLEQDDIEIEPNSSQSSRPYARLTSMNSLVDSCDLFEDFNICGRGVDTVNLRLGRMVKHRSHTYISNKHFEIRRDRDKHFTYIKDISTNGTFKNKEKLEKNEEVPLIDGDVISLGYPDLLVFLYEEHVLNQCPPELESKYIITNVCLGKGTYGKVVLARLRSDLTKNYAIKIIDKNAKNRRKIEVSTSDLSNEISILVNLNHANVVRLHDYVENKLSTHIVLEYVGGGDFFNFIVNPKWKSFGIGDALGKFYSYQFLTAVSYLHERGISHRDLKPENILLLTKDDFTIAKLTDFGLSKPVNKSTMKTFCGTVGYIAPEMIDADGTPYSNKVDIWSLGVVIFTALVGYPPFSDFGDNVPVNEQIRTGRLKFLQTWKRISIETQAAVRKMLQVQENTRPTAAQLLEDRWMKGKEAALAKKTIEEYVAGNSVSYKSIII